MLASCSCKTIHPVIVCSTSETLISDYLESRDKGAPDLRAIKLLTKLVELVIALSFSIFYKNSLFSIRHAPSRGYIVANQELFRCLVDDILMGI